MVVPRPALERAARVRFEGDERRRRMRVRTRSAGWRGTKFFPPARPRCVPVEAVERRVLLSGSVVINELHVDPDVNTDLVEYVELTNPGDQPVNLAGAAFTS